MTNPSDAPVPLPREQLPIPLFDGIVLAVRRDDAAIALALRDLCATLQLDLSSQRRRILADDQLRLWQFRVQTNRQFRTLDFLPLDDLPLWLLTVQQRRVSVEARRRIAYIKDYLVESVRAAFAELTGLSGGGSRQIEDLADLDRIEQAFTTLAALGTRQEQLEGSQNRARDAFRSLRAELAALRDRVQQIEQHNAQTLSPTQRGVIYHLVQTWGVKRAEQAPKEQPGVAIRRCWGELNAAYKVRTYTELPAAHYADIVRWVKAQYHALTGEDLDAGEQQSLGLE